MLVVLSSNIGLGKLLAEFLSIRAVFLFYGWKEAWEFVNDGLILY